MAQSQVDRYVDALGPQTGGGFEFPVYAGRTMSGRGFNFPVYAGRYQYGQGFSDVVRGIWRFFRPVAMSGAQSLLRAGSEAIKDGATVKDVLQNTLKPALGSMLTSTAEQVASRLATAAPPVEPAKRPENSLLGTQSDQKGSGVKRRALYKSHKKKQSKRSKTHYNF